MSIILYFAFLLIEIIVLAFFAIYGITLIFSSVKGAPYVPTSQKRVDKILKEAHLKKGQTFLELGSGDGRIVRTAVRQYGVTGIGIDINPVLTFIARLYAKKEKLNTIFFKTQNVFDSDLSKAHVIYIFLMPALILKLIPRFSKLPKKTILISHGFKIEGWDSKIYKTIKTEPFSTFYYRI